MTLSGSYHLKDRCLFSGLNFELPAGKWTCLLGSSGVGKSTLLRLLANLPVHGEFDGTISFGESPVPQKIAYMAQDDLLLPWLSVKRNVMLGDRLRGDQAQEKKALSLIEQVGLASDVNKRPHELSGGMRQRTALARTLMEDTPIVLLDEPFSALDTRNRRKMQSLAYTALQGKTVLLVTHDPLEALRLADSLYVMTESGLVEQALPDSPPIRSTEGNDIISAQTKILAALNAA